MLLAPGGDRVSAAAQEVHNCYYSGYRYGLSRGWDGGDWYCDCELAGVYDAIGQTVPSGSTSATITGGGSLSVQLAPNAGATPMGSYYTAVYHLDDGSGEPGVLGGAVEPDAGVM